MAIDQNNPFADLPDTQNDPFADLPDAQQGESGILPALGAGVDQLQELGYRAVKGFTDVGVPQEEQTNAIGRAIGQGGSLSQWADEGIRRNQQEQQAYSPTVESYKDIDSIGDAASYVGEMTAQSIPMMGAALNPAGLFVMGGGMSNEAYEAQPEDNKQPWRAAASGFGQAGLERLGVETSIGRLLGGQGQNVVRRVGQSALGEGATETGQEALAQWGAGKSVDEFENLDEAFVGGFAVGGAIRGGTEAGQAAYNKYRGEKPALNELEETDLTQSAVSENADIPDPFADIGPAQDQAATGNEVEIIPGETAGDTQPNWQFGQNDMPYRGQVTPYTYTGEYEQYREPPRSVPVGQVLEAPIIDGEFERPRGLPDRSDVIIGEDGRPMQQAQEFADGVADASNRALPFRDVIYGEDNRNVQVKRNGKPFGGRKAAQITKEFRQAKEQGLNPQVIKVNGGYGWVADGEQQAPTPEVTPQNEQPTITTKSAQKREAPKKSTRSKVYTPNGRELEVEYAIVDADQLVTSNTDDGRVNPDYPQTLQPRDRTRASSEIQINSIANNLNPALLGESATTGDGAPIISDSGIVESGNGRSLALKRAYQNGKASKYRSALIEQGYDVSGVEKPVLARVRRTQLNDEDLVNYTKESNERSTLSLSASETAKADGNAISNIISDFKGGDVSAAGNRDFVRKFMQGAVSQSEQASMIDSQGMLSQDGRRRIEAAMIANAYENTELVNDLFESSDNDIKSIGGALLDASGDWAKMRAAKKAGATQEDVDITPNVIDAVNLVRRSRSEGKKLSEMVSQTDIFAGDIDPTTKVVLGLFYGGDNFTKPRSRQRVKEALTRYAELASSTNGGDDLFGGELETVKPEQLLGQANAINEQTDQQAEAQTSLLDQNPEPAGQSSTGDRGEGQRPTASENGQAGTGSQVSNVSPINPEKQNSEDGFITDEMQRKQNETFRKGLLSRIKYLKNDTDLDKAVQDAKQDKTASVDFIREVEAAANARKAQLAASQSEPTETKKETHGVTVTVPTISKDVEEAYNRTTHLGRGRDFNAELNSAADDILNELNKKGLLDTPERKAKAKELTESYLSEQAQFTRRESIRSQNNPSWIVTGRDKLDTNKYNKRAEKNNKAFTTEVDKLDRMRKSIASSVEAVMNDAQRKQKAQKDADSKKAKDRNEFTRLAGTIAADLTDGRNELAKETRKFANKKMETILDGMSETDAKDLVQSVDKALNKMGGLVKVVGARSNLAKRAKTILEGEQAKPAQSKPNQETKNLSPTEQRQAFWDKYRNADETITADEARAALDVVIDNEAEMKEHIASHTVAQIKDKFYRGWHDSGMKKDQLVNASYRQMVKEFGFVTSDSGVISITDIDGKPWYELTKDKLKNLTDEQLRENMKARKAKVDEAFNERRQRIEGMSNPRTLEDFRNAVRNGLQKDFTPEQWAQYDRLHADQRLAEQAQRETKQISAVDGDVNYELHEATHSKKGHELFIVSLADRVDRDLYTELNTKAKQLGGYYSAYNKQGAIPGFQFRTEDARSEFLKVLEGESVEKTKVAKDKTASLEELADRIEERANGTLNADRKTNTAKRAREAGYAIESAEAELSKAKELRALANSIKDGTAKYLTKLSSGTERDLMASLWNRLRHYADKDLVETKREGGVAGGLKWKEGVTPEQKVRSAEYPLTRMYPDMVKRVASKMAETKGYTMAGKKLLADAEAEIRKQKDGRGDMYIANHKHFGKFKEFIQANSENAYYEEVAKDFNRLQRMGIFSTPMLRAALLEYDAITRSIQPAKRSNQLKKQIELSKFQGQYKENDFFNSTPIVAKQVMELAEIEEGMSVFEPSAGVGSLADAAAEVVGKGNVDTNELASGLREYLTEQGYRPTSADFLTMNPSADYDRIIMNPPFSKGQEARHVAHAYRFLKPGGRLVAVTSSMAGERSNKVDKQFREWLDEIGADETPLPEGAFKEAINSTNVNSKTIVIDKPQDADSDVEPPLFALNAGTVTSNTNTSAVSRSNANEIVGRFLKGLSSAGKNYVSVVSSYDDLPKDIKDAAKAQGAEYQVKGVFHKGKVHVVLDQHTSGLDMETTLFHEVYGHLGVKNLFGNDVTKKLNELFIANGGLKGLRATAKRHGVNLEQYIKGLDGTNMPQEVKNRVLMDELLAHMQQSNKPSVKRKVKEIVGFIRQKLRDLGLASLAKVSDSDLFYVLKQARAAAKNGPSQNSTESLFRTTDNDATFSAPVEKRWSKDWFKRKLQDKFAPIADMQASIENATGQELPENQNAYRAEELFYGKTENDLNKIEENHIKPLVDAMTKNNIESGELDQYLMAKHAEERNAYIASINPELQDGGSGMTNAEAREILSRYEQEGKLRGLSAAAKEVYKITKKRKDLIRNSGLEEESLLDVWDANYEFYVPLKGFAEDSEGNTIAKTGSGFDIRGKESMRAMGRRTMAESPTAHAIQDLSATIIRTRKNDVAKTFLNLVEANPNPDIWEVFTDENPDTERRIVNGEVKESQPIDMRSRKDDYFAVKVDGKAKYIKLKDKDGLLMNAMKNMGPEQMNTFTRSMSEVTRWLSMVNTSLNPEFTVTNFTRDIQTALFNALAEQDLTDGKVKDKAVATKMIKGSGKAVKSLWKHSAGKLDESDPMYKWIDDFLNDGAKTGYFDSKEVDKIGTDLADLLDMANGTNKGKLLKAKNKIGNFIEGVNGGIENGVRLSAYIEARKAGVPRAKAASFAKNLTVNFNRKGEIGTFLNSLYMFFNAAVQGNVNFARAIITPKVDEATGKKSLNMAQKVAAGITISSFGWAALMREMAGDDEDDVPYWDKIPKGVRERNFIIPKTLWGGEPGEYIKIPLPYGYNIFYNLGDAAEAAINSDTRKSGDLAAEMALSVYASFVPLGSPVGDNGAESIALVAAPTITKPIVELALNKNFFGGPIYRENNPYGSELRDSKMSMRSTGEAYKWMAGFMNDVVGDGRNYKVNGDNPWYDVSPDSIEHLVEFSLGGLYRFGSRIYDNVAKSSQGGDLESTDLPFARQLNGKVQPYADITQFYEARQQLKNIDAEMDALRGKDRLEFRKEYGNKLRLQSLMSSLDKRMKLLRKQRDRVEISESLSYAEKEKRLQSLEDKMKTTAARFNKRWNEVD